MKPNPILLPATFEQQCTLTLGAGVVPQQSTGSLVEAFKQHTELEELHLKEERRLGAEIEKLKKKQHQVWEARCVHTDKRNKLSHELWSRAHRGDEAAATYVGYIPAKEGEFPVKCAACGWAGGSKKRLTTPGEDYPVQCPKCEAIGVGPEVEE